MMLTVTKKQKEKDSVKAMMEIIYSKVVLLAVFSVVLSACSVKRMTTEKPVDSGEEIKINSTLYDLVYVEGIKEKMKGNIGEAVNKFEDALKINPGSDAANYQISQISSMRRDYANALKYGRRAAELDAQNPWYMINMANVYIQVSQLDSAARWIEKVLEIEPDNDEEKYRLGNIYLQTGNNSKAEEIFEEFYSKYGGNEQILSVLIEIKVSMGKYEDATNILMKELSKRPGDKSLEGILAEVYRKSGDMEKAEEIYKELVDSSEYNAALDYSYNEFLLETGNYMKLFERAGDIIESDDYSDENKIGLMLRLMDDSVLVSDYADELISMGKKLVQTNKEDPGINMILAEIYGKTGNQEMEIKTMTDYVDEYRAQYYVWEKLLLTLNDIENTELIHKYSERAAKLFNTAPLPKIIYAYALIEKEEYEKAEGELEKVRILVNNQDVFLVQILSMEAEIAYRQGEAGKAFDKFDQALKIEPENTIVLNNYAYYLAEEDMRLDDARKMIEKALKTERSVTYLDTYAWILYKKKKIREADRVMNEIFTSANITDAELLEHYGYIKYAMGECDKAVKLWQAAVKYDNTKDYLIEEIRQCLEK